jgi:hypothetical protein
MNLRAFILLGWKASENPGPLDAEVLYCGGDGLELLSVHQKAIETKSYVAFRKLINPSGTPMAVVNDPPPKLPVFPKAEIVTHQPSLNKKLEENAAKIAAEKKVAEEKRAAEDKANAEKQAIADAAEKASKAFRDLSAKGKPELLASVEEFNEIAPEGKKIVLPPDAKKPDIIAALLAANNHAVTEPK